MAQAHSLSLAKFQASVQAAVAAAVQKHPKFKIDPPRAVAISYLIRGIPVPEAILAHATFAETQAFAADIAAHIGGAVPGAAPALERGAHGAVLSIGQHVIIGIPPAEAVQLFEA